MTDFITIGFTILASCVTYFVCSNIFHQFEAHVRRQQQRQMTKDTIIVSRELRSWVSLFYPQRHNLHLQTAPIQLNTSPINLDVRSNRNTVTSSTTTPSTNIFSTLLPLVSAVLPLLRTCIPKIANNLGLLSTPTSRILSDLGVLSTSVHQSQHNTARSVPLSPPVFPTTSVPLSACESIHVSPPVDLNQPSQNNTSPGLPLPVSK